jgi:hypothetical protein
MTHKVTVAEKLLSKKIFIFLCNFSCPGTSHGHYEAMPVGQ